MQTFVNMGTSCLNRPFILHGEGGLFVCLTLVVWDARVYSGENSHLFHFDFLLFIHIMIYFLFPLVVLCILAIIIKFVPRTKEYGNLLSKNVRRICKERKIQQELTRGMGVSRQS